MVFMTLDARYVLLRNINLGESFFGDSLCLGWKVWTESNKTVDAFECSDVCDFFIDNESFCEKSTNDLELLVGYKFI